MDRLQFGLSTISRLYKFATIYLVQPKRLPYSEFKKIYSKVPRACVDLVIKSKKGIILIRRDSYPYQGYWHLPGGTIFLGEKLKDAVKRVAKDETGLKIKIEKTIGIMEFPVIKDYGQPISIVHLLSIISGKPDGEKIKFFDKLPPKVIPQHTRFLKQHKIIS